MAGVWKRLSARFMRYWRAGADIREVTMWVTLFMVLCPALLMYSGYAVWAYALVVPILGFLIVRIIRQLV